MRHDLRRSVQCTVYSVVLVAGHWLLVTARDARAETANRIVAIVNDEIITESDVTAHMAELLEEFERVMPKDVPTEDVARMALQRLIDRRLILQEAKELKLVVEHSEVEERLKKTRERFESDEAFRESLAAAHLTEGQLREKLRDQLTVQALIDAKVRSTISVSPYEVANVLSAKPELARTGERVRATHLLVRVDENRSEDAARERIEAFRREAAAGEDFAALAKRHSEDPQDGVIEWASKGELLPELDAVLFSLAPGTLSELIRTKLGFHLVRVEECRTADSLSVLEANQAVYQQLYQQKFAKAFREWIEGLRRRAYIQIVQ